LPKRNATSGTAQGIAEQRVQALEDRVQRLQETTDVLIASIDNFRDRVAYAFHAP
jgi:hypothetical protein